jgi:hypothetical protein
MSVKPLSAPTKRLAQPITSSATSFAVNNIRGWDGNNLSAANFGTIAFAVFRDSANSVMEIVQIDPSTIANSTITITTRGLDFNGGTSNVPANQLNWPANDTLVDFGSDPAQLFTQYANLGLAQNINGVWTFTTGNLPILIDAPTGSTQAANKAYVDSVTVAGAPNASTTVKGIVQEATASQINSGTATGSTGAILVVAPDQLALSNLGLAAAGNNTSIAVGSGNKLVTQTGLQNKAETYASSTGSANAYVLTLSPVPTALVAGQEFEFKANFANTGAATLNVNSLGAIAIKKVDGATALVSGDIANGQIVKVKYDGTNFQMISPSANSTSLNLYKTGATTIDMSLGSATTIAHGLGVIPKFIRITILSPISSGAGSAMSFGSYNGTTQSSTFSLLTSTGPFAGLASIDTSNIGRAYKDNSGPNFATYAATFDATNITLTPTKTGTPTGTANVLWEALA